MKKLINQITSHALFTSSMIVFVGSMASNVAAYLYHLFVGRILGPVGYGELAALISFMYILNVPGTIINTGLVKYFSMLKARGQEAQAHHIFDQMNVFMIIGCSIGAIIVLPLTPLLSNYLHLSDSWNGYRLYLVFAGYMLTIPTIALLGGYQLFTPLTVVNCVNSFFRLIFGLIGAFFGIAWTLVANILSNIVSAILGFVYVKQVIKKEKKVIDIPWNRALRFSAPLALATIAAASLISTDVVLVKHYFNPQTAGIYAAISVLGKIIFFASNALNLVIFPMVTERHTKGESFRGLVFSATGIIAAISIILTTVYFIFPGFVVHLLFGKAFDEAAHYVGYMGIFFTFAALITMFNQILLAVGDTRGALFIAGAAILQIAYITLLHRSLFDVMTADVLATGICTALLGFFVFGHIQIRKTALDI